MLWNNTSRVLRYIVTIAGDNVGTKGNLLIGETRAFPAAWIECHLLFEKMARIAPHHPRDVITTLNDGKALLTREGGTFIVRDNQQHILFVRNQANYPITFWNSSECSPESIVVRPKTWMSVVGKTSVCSAFGDEEMFFLEKDAVQIANLTVTFSHRKGNPIASDVTIT